MAERSKELPDESILSVMLASEHINRPIHNILGGLGIEHRVDEPRYITGVPSVMVDKTYGHSQTVKVGDKQLMIVDDSFPFALERAGIPEDTAWFTAAVFSGLQYDFITGLRLDQRTVELLWHVRKTSRNERFWAPDADPWAVAASRLAAGLALRQVDLTPDYFDLPDAPPYPNHIAGFMDPIDIPRPIY